MSRRTEQIASTLQRALNEVLARGLNDPRVRGLISVTEVKVSPDLKAATVSVSVWPEEHEKLALHGIRSASAYIRREVGELVALRRVPDLDFRVDHALKRQAEVYRALADAREKTPGLESDLPGVAEGDTETPNREDQNQ